MTKKEFADACKRRGFVGPALYGYYAIGCGTHVCAFNGGRRRRDQLAYLIAEHERAKDRRRREKIRVAAPEMLERLQEVQAHIDIAAEKIAADARGRADMILAHNLQRHAALIRETIDRAIGEDDDAS
jgi:hypothetical protein